MRKRGLFFLLVAASTIGAINAGGCGGKRDDLACRCGGPCPSPTPSESPTASPSPTPEDDAQAFSPTQDTDSGDGGCE